MYQYKVEEIETARIYSDDEFNCRGCIAPMDVVGLARDIEEHGLQFPIAVQPLSEVTCVYPSGKDFRIIAGHRRFAACMKILKWQKIPALIKTGLSETQARLMNLAENLQRKALNILQEAQAIVRLKDLGLSREAVAKELGQNSSWVQVRFYLLEMPEEIQKEAAAGIITQYQIMQLHTLRSPAEMFEAVKKIKTAKANNEKVPHIGRRRRISESVAKERKRDEIEEMMAVIRDRLGNSIATRCLAWAAGNINTLELYKSLTEYAESSGKKFIPPKIHYGQDDFITAQGKLIPGI